MKYVTDFVEVDFFHRDIAELRDTSPRKTHGIQLGNESDVKPRVLRTSWNGSHDVGAK